MEQMTLTQIVTIVAGVGAIWGVYAKLVKLIRSEVSENEAGFLMKFEQIVKGKVIDYDKIEHDKRMLRQEKYESEFNNLNSKAESAIDKIISIESEIKDEGGLLNRIRSLEFEIKGLKGDL